MKSASQWLASSDDDDDGVDIAVSGSGASAEVTDLNQALPPRRALETTQGPSPVNAAEEARKKREEAAEERRRQAQALRERMQQALGEDAVKAIAAPSPSADGPPKSADSPVVIRRKGSAGQARRSPPAGPAAAPAAKPSVKDRIKNLVDSFTSDDATSVSETPKGLGTAGPERSSAELPPVAPVRPMSADAMLAAAAPDETVIMVANRGTQTAGEMSTQTDPEPHTMSCPACYQAYYGHAPLPGPICGGGAAGHAPAPVYQFGGAHGYAFQPQTAMMAGPGGVLAANGIARQFGGGGFGYPAGGPVDQPRLVPASVYRQQVDAIQSRIDAIIAKHNLPAMPRPA